jgi:hypothetical protein
MPAHPHLRSSTVRTPRALRHRPLVLCAVSIIGLALLVSGSAFSGCSKGDAASSRAQGGPEERVGELIEAFTPLDRTVTSDISDAKFIHGQKVLEELSHAGPVVGHAALVALQEKKEKPVDVERALLTVAARANPAETVPLLESLLTQYGASLSLRTEATLLLAEVAPARAIELLEPLVTKQRQSQTMPEEEFLLKAWVIACDKTGRSPVKELCDVATNIFQPGYARVLAVRELGKRPDPRGEAALRAIVIESTGDGYLRRITIQSLHELLPAETACELFRKVAEKEADMNFLRFLADAIEKWCGG